MAKIRIDTPERGNVLPPGMFYRAPVYYVKKMIRGRTHKQSTGKRDFKSALRRYHEIMKAWNDGDSGWASKVPSFDTYFQKHYRPAYTMLKTPKVSRVDPLNKRYRDDDLVKSFTEFHGAKPLDAVTKTLGQKWVNLRRLDTYTRQLNGKGKHYPISEGTVAREVALLHAIFSKAIDDGFIDRNPWKGIDVEDYASKERVLSLEEQQRVLAQLPPKYQRWLLFMIGTGLRLEEARGLDPALDIDFAKRTVKVTRKTRGRKKKVQQVPLIDLYLLDILQEQLTAEGQLWPQAQETSRELTTTVAKKVGIEHFSPHALRHTFATRYLQGGGDIYVLSKILGHSSVRTTERVYAHLLSDDLALRSQHVKLGLRPAEPGKVLPFPGHIVVPNSDPAAEDAEKLGESVQSRGNSWRSGDA